MRICPFPCGGAAEGMLLSNHSLRSRPKKTRRAMREKDGSLGESNCWRATRAGQPNVMLPFVRAAANRRPAECCAAASAGWGMQQIR